MAEVTKFLSFWAFLELMAPPILFEDPQPTPETTLRHSVWAVFFHVAMNSLRSDKTIAVDTTGERTGNHPFWAFKHVMKINVAGTTESAAPILAEKHA